MDKISTLGSYLSSSSNLLRFVPEPKSRVASAFSGVMRSVGQTISGGSSVSLDPSYQALLEKQIELQEQMQRISMESNIEKTRHESKMSAVRNFRAG